MLVCHHDGLFEMLFWALYRMHPIFVLGPIKYCHNTTAFLRGLLKIPGTARSKHSHEAGDDIHCPTGSTFLQNSLWIQF